MSVKVRPYKGREGQWEVDIRFEWPDGGEYRERKKAPVSSKSGAQRWAEQRERELLTAPKNGRTREVPMTNRLHAALKAHRHLRGPRVLVSDDGKPIMSRMIQRWMERVERRAGVDVGGRLHIFRHSFCSHLAIKGAPARAVQALAGHADLTTKMRYMHLSPAARVSAIQLLNDRPQDAEERLGEMLETGQPCPQQGGR